MPHDSYPPAQQNSRKCRAKSTSPSSDHRKGTVFREFFRDLFSPCPSSPSQKQPNDLEPTQPFQTHETPAPAGVSHFNPSETLSQLFWSLVPGPCLYAVRRSS